MSTTPPIALVEQRLASPDEPSRGRRKQRSTKIRGYRPGFWVYAGLGVVVLAAIFPYYWSFLIGSGDASTINDPDMSWIPGGNFLANAASVVNDPAVNFWPALWNSIYSSALIAASVVLTSTLAGWAFAKLRFPGSKWLLVFVVATMAVPMQLGVVPLYILFADLGWTGQIGAIIIFWPFIVLDRQNPTLPVALSLLQSNYFVDYSVVLAGVLLSTIPLLLLFAVAGKQLVSGIMAGAVKG